MRLSSLDRRLLPGLAALAAACAGHNQPAPNSAPTTTSTATSAPAPAQVPMPTTGTATDTVPSNVAHEYRGAYTSGFEMSWFEPCDRPANDRMWWVTLTGDAVQQRDSLLARLGKSGRPKSEGLLVRWRGTISRRMPAGHMGRGTRYMLVTEVLDIQPLPGAGACATT